MAVAALVSASPASAYLYKEIRDWAVTCSGGLTCTMSVNEDDRAGGVAAPSFRRTSAPDAAVDLILPVPDGVDAQTDFARFSLSVDGKAIVTTKSDDLAVDPVWNAVVYADPPSVRALLDAMKSGQSMTYAVEAGGKTAKRTISLSGVTGSLLYIDEAQQRLDHVDALQAVGPKPAADRAPARDITSYADVPESIRADFTDDAAECGGAEEARLSYAGGFEIELDEGGKLLVMPCGMGGAYNQPFVFYRGYDGEFTQLGIPFMGDKGPYVETMAYNIGYEADDKTFSAFFKGRGIGDCGSMAVWELADRGEGPALMLIEQREKNDCDGNYDGGPENWPAVWPR